MLGSTTTSSPSRAGGTPSPTAVDPSEGLVALDPRVRRRGPRAAEDREVRAAQADPADGDPHVVGPRLRIRDVADDDLARAGPGAPPSCRVRPPFAARPAGPAGSSSRRGLSTRIWWRSRSVTPAVPQHRQDAPRERLHVPARSMHGPPGRRRDVAEERGVMREDHAVGVAEAERARAPSSTRRSSGSTCSMPNRSMPMVEPASISARR